MVRYRCWVPNKTGKLSFSQIGKQNPDGIIYRKNHDCKTGCVYLVAQDRSFILDDSLFSLYSRFARPLMGVKDTIFILSGDCEKKPVSSDTLIGQIWCKYGRINGKNFQNDIGGCDKVFSAKYKLFRNGECKITCVLIGENITFKGEYKHVEEWIASQCYMFLKDILHRHKHHPKSSDTFLDIKIWQRDDPWKKYIAYSLGNMAIKTPNTDKPTTFQNTLGVLSYLQSLLHSHSLTHLYDDENIKAWRSSLTAEHANITFNITGRRWLSGLILSAYSFSSKIFINAEPGMQLGDYIYWGIYAVLLASILQFSSIYSIMNWRWVTDVYKVLSNKSLLATACLILVAILLIKYAILPAV